MERHNETDEVFVMIKGQGILFLGDGRRANCKNRRASYGTRIVYNVKQGTWHSVVLSRDGSVLIVENKKYEQGELKLYFD